MAELMDLDMGRDWAGVAGTLAFMAKLVPQECSMQNRRFKMWFEDELLEDIDEDEDDLFDLFWAGDANQSGKTEHGDGLKVLSYLSCCLSHFMSV